jgi:L-rhamnose isomerase
MCCVLIYNPAKANESQRKHIVKKYHIGRLMRIDVCNVLHFHRPASQSQRKPVQTYRKQNHFSEIRVINPSICCVFICNAAKASEGQCKDIVKKYYLKKIMRINIFSVLRLHRQAKQSQRKPAQTYCRKIVLKENHNHERLGCVAF